MIKKSTNKGVTLIELIVYMGMLSVILIIMVQLFGSAFDVRRETEAVSYSTIDTRNIYQRMLYDIENADSIIVPANPGDQSSSLQLVKNGVTYTYQIANNSLTANGVALNSFGTTISDLTFLRLGNAGGIHTIRMSYSVTSRVKKNSTYETRTITTTFGMR